MLRKAPPKQQGQGEELILGYFAPLSALVPSLHTATGVSFHSYPGKAGQADISSPNSLLAWLSTRESLVFYLLAL